MVWPALQEAIDDPSRVEAFVEQVYRQHASDVDLGRAFRYISKSDSDVLIREFFRVDPDRVVYHMESILDDAGDKIRKALVDLGVIAKLKRVPDGLNHAATVFLLKNGIDINDQDEKGRTLLHDYINSYHPRDNHFCDVDADEINELIDLGADLTIRDNDGMAPIDMGYACEGLKWMLLYRGSPPPREPEPDFQWASGTHDMQIRRAATVDALDAYLGTDYFPGMVDLVGRYIHLGPEHEIHVLRRALRASQA